MKRITKIEENAVLSRSAKKLRVAAYCRVSSSSEDQLISLEAQKMHYESYIKENEEWDFAGIYYDEGITGTKKEKRPEFLRMIADCEHGKIDFIITKSISRFARNTTDCLELVRKLLELGVPIYFEKENLNTASMESELMLSILSSLAESESVSISQNSKWSVQRRYQNGTFIIAYPPYGYENVNGEMVINEEQAEVVRFIFSETLKGVSSHKIAEYLRKNKVPSKRDGKWSASTIRGILENEKYIGDVLYQKTYTDNRFTRHENHGEYDQYYVEGHHEPIISREVFEQAALVAEQISKEKGIEKGNSKYSNSYPFTQKIICNECGSFFKRRIHTCTYKYVAWACTLHIHDKDKCSMLYIRESEFERAFVTMMNKLVFAQKKMMKPLLEKTRESSMNESLKKVNQLENSMEKNVERRQTLRSLMAKGYLDPAIFTQENNMLEQEYMELRNQKELISTEITDVLDKTKEIGRLVKYLEKAEMITGFDADIFKEYVDHIRVFSREEIGFVMKCGLMLREKVSCR